MFKLGCITRALFLSVVACAALGLVALTGCSAYVENGHYCGCKCNGVRAECTCAPGCCEGCSPCGACR